MCEFIRDALADGNDTILRPLTRQGDMVLGLVQDGEATFMGLGSVPDWAGIPELEDAGPKVIAAYVCTYGPTSTERISTWFSEGLGAKRRDIARWLNQLEGRLAHISIDGDHVLMLEEDVEGLRTSRVSDAVHLLPGRDPWVVAPGTSDARVVPPELRGAVSRSANLVIAGGRVTGTWMLRKDHVDVELAPASDQISPKTLTDATPALSTFLARPVAGN